MTKEERRSIAQYPSPGGDGDDEDMDMADAIPSWTQPKPREGNWDDVSNSFSTLFHFCFLLYFLLVPGRDKR